MVNNKLRATSASEKLFPKIEEKKGVKNTKEAHSEMNHRWSVQSIFNQRKNKNFQVGMIWKDFTEWKDENSKLAQKKQHHHHPRERLVNE